MSPFAPRKDASWDVPEAIENGIGWLLGLQNRDGGFPTFCKGWGTLPFDRSAPDLTAHCLRALIFFFGDAEFMRDAVHGFYVHVDEEDHIDPDLSFLSLSVSARRAFKFLEKTQRPDGSWLPLWFGNQHAPDDINPTYGTARVLAAYRDAEDITNPIALSGVQWLKDNQNADGGWGGVKGVPSSVEETALATEILLSWEPNGKHTERGLMWLMDRVESGEYLNPTPIGFYFAKLWYFEGLYPLIFTVQSLGRAVRTLNAKSSSAPKTPHQASTLSPACAPDGTDNN